MKIPITPCLALLAAVIGTTVAWPGEIPEATKGKDITVLRGDDVPYAYRASVLFHQIASAHGRRDKEGPDVESLLSSIGLDASAEDGDQLVQLALELEREHPYVIPDGELAPFGKDYEAINAYLERRENERLEAVGEGLGRWLLDREASNLAVDPLLNRLLNGPHMSVSMFSTEDTEAELRSSVQGMVESFERGMIRGFGSVPRRLEWTP